jgi:hypothetical protein
MFYLENFNSGKYAHRAEALLKDNLNWHEHDVLQQEKQQLNEAVKLFLIEKDEDEKKRIAFAEKVRATYQRLEKEKTAIITELKERRHVIKQEEGVIHQKKEYLTYFDAQLTEKETTLKETESALSEKENTLLGKQNFLEEREQKLTQEQDVLSREKTEIAEEIQKLGEKSAIEKASIKEMHEGIIAEKKKIVEERELLLQTFNNQKSKFLAEKEAYYTEKKNDIEQIAADKMRINAGYSALDQAKQNWVEEQVIIENEIVVLTEKATLIADENKLLLEEKRIFKEEQAQLKHKKNVFEIQKGEEAKKWALNDARGEDLDKQIKYVADFEKQLNEKSASLAKKESDLKKETELAEAAILDKNKVLEEAQVAHTLKIEELEEAYKGFVAKETKHTDKLAMFEIKEKEQQEFEVLLKEEEERLNHDKNILHEQFQQKYDAFALEKQNWEAHLKQTHLKHQEAVSELQQASEAFEKLQQENETAIQQTQQAWEREREEILTKETAHFDALQDAISKKEEVLKLNKTQLTKDREQFDAELLKWETEKQGIYQQLSHLQNALANEKEKSLETINTIKKLEQQEATLKQSLGVANENYTTSESQLKEMKKAFEAENVKLTNEKSGLEQVVIEKEQIITLLNTDQEAFAERIRQLENKLLLVNEKMKNKSADLNSFKKEKANLFNELTEIKQQGIEKEKTLITQKNKLEAEFASQKVLMEKEKELIKDLQSQKQASLEKQLADQSTNHQQELDKITHRFEQENKKAIERGEERIIALQTELDKAKSELQKVSIELQLTEQKATEHENDHQESIASQKEMLAEVVSLKARLNSIEQFSEKKAKLILDVEDEENLWAKTVAQGTEKAFKAYLENTNEGTYRDEANLHLATLKNISETVQKTEMNDQVQEVVAKKDDLKKVGIDQKVVLKEEETLWKYAQSENTTNAYRHYLHQSKAQKYVDAAQERIQALQNQNLKSEEMLWQKASEGNSTELLNAYLEQFPSGKYASQVIFKLDELNKD